ncbi:hypothetical protein DMUE_6068 [Dictyocoela muelleri]|nr:hypothetical protein DMUE_6068 [Dictyocoela muelleri]
MPRKSKRNVTKRLVKDIEKHINDNKSLRDISRFLSISHSTTKRIVNLISCTPNFAENFVENNGKRNRNNIINDITPIISNIIDEKNDLSLTDIQIILLTNNIETSISLICRGIKRIKYTRKRLSLIPIERNTPPPIIEIRRVYAQSIE